MVHWQHVWYALWSQTLSPFRPRWIILNSALKATGNQVKVLENLSNVAQVGALTTWVFGHLRKSLSTTGCFVFSFISKQFDETELVLHHGTPPSKLFSFLTFWPLSYSSCHDPLTNQFLFATSTAALSCFIYSQISFGESNLQQMAGCNFSGSGNNRIQEIDTNRETIDLCWDGTQKGHFRVLHSGYGRFLDGEMNTANVCFEHKPHICFSLSTILNQESIKFILILDGCWNKCKKQGYFGHADGYIQCFYLQANFPQCKLCIVSCTN